MEHSKFVIIKNKGDRVAIAKDKIIYVKEIIEQNSVGIVSNKVALLLENGNNEEFTEIVVYDSFDNIMLELEG